MKAQLISYSVIITVLFLFTCYSCTGQKEKAGVLFYNVENLFDTINSPYTLDDEFTPASEKHWNTERYNTKLLHLATVIASAGTPAIIGLAEIENKKVLDDLIAQKPLLDDEYSIVHFDSPDERGIDVAMLYKKDAIKILDTKPIQVHLPEDNGGTTRDILYVSAQLRQTKQQLHIFINHWPSRSEGEELTRVRREIAAETLRKAIDSINAEYNEPAILIMGDFNDTPEDASIRDILQAMNLNADYCDECLVNLLTDLNASGDGSYFYNGNWQVLDQFIVSESMLQHKVPYVDPASVRFIKNAFQFYKNDKYGNLPNRTYSGTKYYGGYSDHLPVYMEIIIK